MIPSRIIYRLSALKILDQKLLPHRIKYLTAKNPLETANAIRDMVVRGAPLIGCTGAYGYALVFCQKRPGSWNALKNRLDNSAKILKQARPTAVALFYAVDRVHKAALRFIDSNSGKPLNDRTYFYLRKAVVCEAYNISKEDKIADEKIACFGAGLLKKGSVVMTHCNAGALATMGIGTAVGVITESYKSGKIKHVYACETRPYLQGSRLTMWELKLQKIPSTLITDNMAGHIMKTCKIDAIFVGADRIALNGDVANKIGTYALAILAKYHKIPFYVVAPVSTIDINIKTGNKIKIEERSPDEVTKIGGIPIAPAKINARHPAFDITPADLITGIITENGIIKPVNRTNIRKNLKW
jgi:methylthioribose-1-phosphate isomerase